MGLLDRIRHREDDDETPCPRCAIPTSANANDCSACGWDLREAYHGVFPGSTVQEAGPVSRE